MADDMRDQIAGAISRYDWEHGISANAEVGLHQRGEADAVMAVVGPELKRLRKALGRERKKARANQTGKTVERLRAELISAKLNHIVDHDDAAGELAKVDVEVERLTKERDALKAALAEQTERTLNAAADKLYALPADGAALKGPYWFRKGFTDAADLLRDWADYPEALNPTETPPKRLTEQDGGIPNDAITPDDLAAARSHPTDTTEETTDGR